MVADEGLVCSDSLLLEQLELHHVGLLGEQIAVGRGVLLLTRLSKAELLRLFARNRRHVFVVLFEGTLGCVFAHRRGLLATGACNEISASLHDSLLLTLRGQEEGPLGHFLGRLKLTLSLRLLLKSLRFCLLRTDNLILIIVLRSILRLCSPIGLIKHHSYCVCVACS